MPEVVCGYAKLRDEENMCFKNRPLAGRSVVLLEGATFLAGYVSEGIRAAGGEIMHSAVSVAEANAAMLNLERSPDAIVADTLIFNASAFTHRETIDRLAIPLLLISNRTCPPESGRDCLSAPFAMYQVVDHLCAKLGLEPTRR